MQRYLELPAPEMPITKAYLPLLKAEMLKAAGAKLEHAGIAPHQVGRAIEELHRLPGIF
jgi:hypothetical protein